MGSNVVFCTTCKNRTQHLELTLSGNLIDNPTAKFIVLDYNSQDHLGTFLRDLHCDQLIVYNLALPVGMPTPFRMAHAKNMAHRCGMLEGGDILVNLDADNYTGPGFAEHLADGMTPGAFMWAKMKPGELKRGISGRIAVTSEAFVKTGGYNERYDSWGSDDRDFNMRLRRLGYTGKEIDDRYLDAVQHNDKMRFREYPGVQVARGEDHIELYDEDATIANFGKFGCGTVFKNFEFKDPIELGPLPTRIFGVGLHKTATTSLHKAFKILGFDSAHWQDAHWAKAIWTEMTTFGRSLTLERHYALCDLPISILYQQLDRAYPGSKFILTVRPEAEWLQSIKRHWDAATNKFRHQWDHDPFTHAIHKLVYGQKSFDPELFLQRYRRHNFEVKEYFRSRPDDLLLFGSDGWEQLCRFLGKPVPGVAYPMISPGV